MRPAWLPMLLFLPACTSPYSFSKEITAVSTGVDQVSVAYTSGYAGLISDRMSQTQLDLTDRRAKANIAPSCGVAVGTSPVSQAPCALYREHTPIPALSGIETDRPKIMAALHVLKNYTGALAAVTNAGDRAAYDAAVAQLSGSVGALAKFADAAAPGASTIAPAAVNFVGWLAGTALDRQRFESLKRAVNTVGKQPIATVAGVLGQGLETLRDARTQVLYEEANVLKSTLGPSMDDGAYRQRLSDAQVAIAALDGLRNSDPQGTTDALAAAHAALVDAVNDPTQNFANLLQTVGEFADKAAALESAFAAVAAPGKTATKKGT